MRSKCRSYCFLLLMTLLASLTLVLAACGGASAPPSPPATAEAQVSLTTNPDPPQSGDVELVVQVNDVQGQPIPDADVYIFADHTEMKGMTMNGKATAQGAGRYATTAGFAHGGKWKVTVQVKKAPLDVVQEFNLELK
ncbi:MAG: FixH family protein [Anaerolineae bacterium]|nr:FixH family protein [Anaerolineae bacterium]